MVLSVFVTIAALIILGELSERLDSMNLYSYSRALVVVMLFAGLSGLFVPVLGIVLIVAGIIFFYKVKI